MKTNWRNLPNQFHRSSTSYPLGPSGVDYHRQWYSFAQCSKTDGRIELGARNPSDREIDKLIDWLQRARRFRKFLKTVRS